MIIVSQPRSSITNFDNITDIELEEYENKSWIIKCYTIDDKHINLAIYKTEERAKEVLQEIIRIYRATEMLKVSINRLSDKVGAIGMNKSFIYEMPED